MNEVLSSSQLTSHRIEWIGLSLVVLPLATPISEAKVLTGRRNDGDPPAPELELRILAVGRAFRVAGAAVQRAADHQGRRDAGAGSPRPVHFALGASAALDGAEGKVLPQAMNQ
jgi:hypothetical protein